MHKKVPVVLTFVGALLSVTISNARPVPGADAHAAVREYERAGVHRVVLFPECAPDKYQRELEDLARTWM